MTTSSVLRARRPSAVLARPRRRRRAAAASAGRGSTEVELLVVGAGLTGLWAGFEAARDGHDVLVVDSGAIGSGASGRCGGFINASITHGIPHGHARWPDEMAAILAIQRRCGTTRSCS